VATELILAEVAKAITPAVGVLLKAGADLLVSAPSGGVSLGVCEIMGATANALQVL
jgi:hypothetical protein